jgi:hypothetical protein
LLPFVPETTHPSGKLGALALKVMLTVIYVPAILLITRYDARRRGTCGSAFPSG